MDIEIKPKYQFAKKYGVIIVVGILLISAIIYAVISAGTTSRETDINAITIGNVSRGLFNDNIRLTGKVETGTSVKISALETGIVESRLIDEGSFVMPATSS